MARRSSFSFRSFFVGFRKVLNDNKIFFEVIVAGLLSWMAITVSMQANKIAERQTLIMEQENLPQWELWMQQNKDPQTGNYDLSTWTVVNKGGKFSDFAMTDLTFVTYSKYSDYESRDLIRIPVYGYLAWRRIHSMDTEGPIYTVDNDHNGALEYKLHEELRAQGILDVDTYVKITYDDIFDKPHEDYYKLSIGTERITKSEYLRMDSIHFYNKRLMFRALTKEQVLNYKNATSKN
nr:hypothetical protein [Pedobacter panaciterrae]